MEKEIRMAYSEYEQMHEILKKQNEAIEKLTKEKCLIISDKRIYTNNHSRLSDFYFNVPEIIGNVEELGQFLDEKHKRLINIKENFDLEGLQHYKNLYEKTLNQLTSLRQKFSNTPWYKRMFNIIDYGK